MSVSHEDRQSNRADAVARLEAELKSERARSTSLSAQLEALTSKVAALESSNGPVADTTRSRIDRVEAQIKEQNARLAKLGEGREQSLVEIRKLEQELKLVAGERDALRRELNRVDGIQSDTVAFDEPDAESVLPKREPARGNDPELPSIAELMAAGADDGPLSGRGSDKPDVEISREDTGWHELLPADLIVAGSPGEIHRKPFSETSRWRLVRTDVTPVIEYPLDDALMTIGRSESADIQIDGDFISRIHARLLRIEASIILEDAGSKNGVRINGERVDRWPLTHGDAVRIGAVPFKFVDTEKEAG